MPGGSFADALCDVVLRDGSTLALRPARADDVPALVAFFAALSDDSRYFRFFSFVRPDDTQVAPLVPLDGTAGVALVGECNSRIVAFAGYYRTAADPQRGEVAFAIADALHGRGVGTRLLERLADIARMQGIRV